MTRVSGVSEATEYGGPVPTSTTQLLGVMLQALPLPFQHLLLTAGESPVALSLRGHPVAHPTQSAWL